MMLRVEAVRSPTARVSRSSKIQSRQACVSRTRSPDGLQRAPGPVEEAVAVRGGPTSRAVAHALAQRLPAHADGVDLVDEDDARAAPLARQPLRLAREVADEDRVDADERRREAGAGDRDERRVEAGRDRLREHRLAGARLRRGRAAPRSRLPPARSNASPDCQRQTTRRTSSFASAWPRTSSSLTPHCASPGSKPRICAEAHQQHRADQDGEVRDEEEEDEDHLRPERGSERPSCDEHRRRAPPGSRRGRARRPRRTRPRSPIFSQKRQNQVRRRATTSSSRSRALSSRTGDGHGIMRRKRRSTTPRNAITSASAASSAFHHSQPFCVVEPECGGGCGQDRDDGCRAAQAAPLVGQLAGLRSAGCTPAGAFGQLGGCHLRSMDEGPNGRTVVARLSAIEALRLRCRA